MDNELDFRVGDVVCDIRFGTGVVVGVKTGDDCWPVGVSFGEIESRLYKFDGRYIDDDKYRSLYHGTWEHVFGNLPDLKPRRKVKRWANLYDSGEFKMFNDKVTAKSFAETTPFKVVAVAVEIEVDE